MAANLTGYGPTGGVAFMVYPSGMISNLAINTLHVMTMDTERFDVGGNFASNTFTAPVTGKYIFQSSWSVDHVTAAWTIIDLNLKTSNRDLRAFYINSGDDIFAGTFIITAGHIVDMDAGDTSTQVMRVAGEGSNVVEFGTGSFYSVALLS